MSLLRLLAVLALLLPAGCAAAPGPAAPPVGLAAPAPDAVRPIDGVELAVGTRYRFADVLPGALDVEVVVPSPTIFPFTGYGHAYLAGDAAATLDVVTFLAAPDIAMYADPLHPPRAETDTDVARDVVRVAPADLLARVSALPFIDVTAPARPVTLMGVTGSALDVAVRELPADATGCGPGEPLCADLMAVPNFGQSVESGQRLRIAVLDTPPGPVAVVQNLADARGDAVLGAARFVPQRLPDALGAVAHLPYAEVPLEPGATYGVAFRDVGVGASFTAGAEPTLAYDTGVDLRVLSADLPAELLGPAPIGYRAGRERLFGYVAPTADLLVPEPGVDPRTLGTAAFARSAGSDGGLVDLIARQPWAEVVTAPATAPVGGLPGRAVEVRLRPGAGTVPCTLPEPEAGMCAVLLYQRSVPNMWLLSERVLRVAEVGVGDARLTVVSGTDADGRTFADSLRLVELPR